MVNDSTERTTHTPGPWKACDGSSVSIDEHMHVVSTHVRHQFVDEQGRRVTQFIADCNELLPQVSANARLIAASPSMLSALKKLVKEIQSFHQTFDANLFVEAERVIALAEGRDAGRL